MKKELLICENQIIIENRRKFAKTIFFIINLVLLNIKKIEKIITNNICLSISNLTKFSLLFIKKLKIILELINIYWDIRIESKPSIIAVNKNNNLLIKKG